MQTEVRSMLLEALSSRTLRCMPRELWQEVFIHNEGRDVRFAPCEVSMVQADPDCPPEGAEAERIAHELRWLATCHNGKVDSSAAPSSLTVFKNPRSALRMALAIQRLANARFRIGIHSGRCTVGLLQARGQRWSVLIGLERNRVAALAWDAVAGTIALSASTFQLLGPALDEELGGALVAQEFEGDQLARATVVLPPRPAAFQSNFMGLGLT